MSETNLLDLLDLTAAEIIALVKCGTYTNEQLVALRDAESAGKTRKTVVEAIDAELAARETLPAAEAPADPVVTPEEQADPEPPVGDDVPLYVAEHRILRADYTGELCEIVVATAEGNRSFTGMAPERAEAYRSAVAAWLASEGKALA